MRNRRSMGILTGALTFLALAAMPLDRARAGGTTEIIHSFGDGDGEYPATDLVVDGAGHIYGTTTQGGDWNSGSVFELAPSGGGWVESVLYSFTSGADGAQPYNGVTLDANGDLYGTAVTGGTGAACEGGCGVVYKLTHSGGTWSQSVLYNFTGGDDGSGPGAGLTFDGQGNLYGMTPTGGAFGVGVIYKLTPDGAGNWTHSVVHAFTGGSDGATGSAGRLLLDGGNFYGVATVGGAYGKGTVFRLTPKGGGGWTFQTLYAFRGHPHGGLPYGALIRDAQGRLYGTTYYEGANDLGAVYQVVATPAGGWRAKVLYSFQGGSDGSHPVSHLNFDASGNLYGTTSEGGEAGCSCGTIFKLTDMGGGTWQETVVHRFGNSPDGANVYNGMVAGPGGIFYGATVHGGDDGDGSIFQFTP